MSRLFLIVLGAPTFVVGAYVVAHDLWAMSRGGHDVAILSLFAVAETLGMADWLAPVLWLLPMLVGGAMLSVAVTERRSPSLHRLR